MLPLNRVGNSRTRFCMRFGMGKNVPWGVRGHLRSLSLGLERRVPRRALFRMMKVRGICSRLHARESAHVRQTSRVWNQRSLEQCAEQAEKRRTARTYQSFRPNIEANHRPTERPVSSPPTNSHQSPPSSMHRLPWERPKTENWSRTESCYNPRVTCAARQWFARCVSGRMRHRRRGLRSPSQCLHCSLPAPS